MKGEEKMPFVEAYCRDCDFETEDKQEAKDHAVKHEGKHNVINKLVAPE